MKTRTGKPAGVKTSTMIKSLIRHDWQSYAYIFAKDKSIASFSANYC